MLYLFATFALSQTEKVTLTGSPIEGVYYPATKAEPKKPAVLILHGSEGSTQFTEFTARALASEGYPALALRYFGGKDQPKHLVRVPIDNLDIAMDWLAKRPEIDPNKVVVLGFSRGAELALSYASMNPKVRGVVAVAPSCMRFQGFIDMATPTSEAAFTYKGKDLPFSVVLFQGKPLDETYAPSLKAKHGEAQWIDAQTINGPILLFSGQKDGVWPSSTLSAKLVERLKASKFPHEVEWHDYPDAGHVLLAKVNEKYTESMAPTYFGGTKAGVFSAMKDAWPRLIGFLKRHF